MNKAKKVLILTSIIIAVLIGTSFYTVSANHSVGDSPLYSFRTRSTLGPSTQPLNGGNGEEEPDIPGDEPTTEDTYECGWEPTNEDLPACNYGTSGYFCTSIFYDACLEPTERDSDPECNPPDEPTEQDWDWECKEPTDAAIDPACQGDDDDDDDDDSALLEEISIVYTTTNVRNMDYTTVQQSTPVVLSR